MPRTLENARAAMRSGDAALALEICEELHLTVGESADSLAVMAAAAALEGGFEAAAGHLRRAISHAPNRPQLHANLGRMLTALGKLDDAGIAFVRALSQTPGDPGFTLHHAAILANIGHPADAARLIRSVADAAPDWDPVVTDLAHAEQVLGNRSLILKAANAARAAGDRRVQTLGVHGDAAARLHSWAVAFDCFQQCADAEPDNAVYQAGLAVSAGRLGKPELSEAASVRALALRPFTVRGATRPRRRALVAEPFSGRLTFLPGRWLGYAAMNYPSILHHPDWQLVHAPIGEGSVEALADIARQCDVLINNWVSAEQLGGNPARKRIETVALQAGLPVINPPALVAQTGRADTFERFRGVPGFVFPKTLRVSGDDMTAAHILERMEPPFILRSSTAHLGRDAHLVAREADLEGALAAMPAGDAYLIRYHECRDTRGIARRFRIGVVDGVCLTLNMHAAEDWNVHHVDRTEMRWTERGLEEDERQFLLEPERLIGAPPEEVFAPIVRRTPLDVYGIDFGIDRDGRIVVFEVNAAMAFSTGKLAAWPLVMEQRQRLIAAIFDLCERRAAYGPAA